MKRPLVAVAACYVAGLFFGEISQPPPTSIFAVSFFVFVLALALKKFRRFSIWPLLMLAG
jgi:hypothetical protein